MPGFEQDDYVAYTRANERSLKNILKEYAAIRRTTISLFENLNEAAFLRTGTANGQIVSVRALAYQIAGHELHHINIIKERYL